MRLPSSPSPRNEGRRLERQLEFLYCLGDSLVLLTRVVLSCIIRCKSIYFLVIKSTTHFALMDETIESRAHQVPTGFFADVDQVKCVAMQACFRAKEVDR